MDIRLQRRALRRLFALNVAVELEDLTQPGFDFHQLMGKPIRYTIHVNGPWCITFEWKESNAERVDFENYHQGQEELMAEYPTKGSRIEPTHPGELMREILEEHVKLSVAEAARRMHVSRPALYAVMNGRSAVTADMALRFGKLVGGAPELYLRMQDAHSLWRARKVNGKVLKAIKTVPLAA